MGTVQPRARAERTFPSNLTEAQADGLACVHCGRDYSRSPGVRAVPLERDGEYVRGTSGSQLFVCANTCEYDVPQQRQAADKADPDDEPIADSYWDGHEAGIRYAEQSPHRTDVPDDAHTLRALYGPPTVDELVKVAAWAGISTTELVEIKDGHPLHREEIRQIHDWVDEVRMNVETLAMHAGVTCVRLGGGRQ